jgi:hypothetical protein
MSSMLGALHLHEATRKFDDDLERYVRLARHAATLTRLTRRISMLSNPRRTHRGLQLRAACTAYDQTLLLAAEDLGLSPGLTPPLHSVERLSLEAELVSAGMRW